MKRKILLLLFLSIFILLFIPQSSLACHLKKGTFYTDSACKNPIEVYDWSWDLGGCDEGISAGAFYSKGWLGSCRGPEAKWKKYPGNDGEICKVKWGRLCEGSFEGKYDASENKCVMCEGKKQVKAVKCGQYDDTTVKCELACGSHPRCDEKRPGDSVDGGDCDDNCNFVPFDFSLSVNPSSGSVVQGESISATVTAVLTSITTRPISFSCSGLPTGTSCTFSPVSCNPTCTSTLTITTSSTTPLGTYTITISGTGGEITRTTTYTLTVFATKCISLINNGEPSQKIDIVFIPSNYKDTPSDRKKFAALVDKGRKAMFSIEPFSTHLKEFNVWRVDDFKDLGCSHGCKGIDRLICCSREEVYRVALQCPYDRIIVIYNHPKFGGVGGDYAVVSSASVDSRPHIVTHEVGHLFNLLDEHSYGGVGSGKPGGPNCDNVYSGSDNIPCPKWANFANQGCYKECTYDNWYRPTVCSVMRSLECEYFNKVSTHHLKKCIERKGCFWGEGTPSPYPLVFTKPLLYFIELRYSDGKLSVKNISLEEGFIPDRILQPSIGYKMDFISIENKEIYSFNFEVPDKVFYDVFDEKTGELIGNMETFHDFDFIVTAPYFSNLKYANFYSPEGIKTNVIDISNFEKQQATITYEACKVGEKCKSSIIGVCELPLNILYSPKEEVLLTPIISREREVEFIPHNKGKIKHVAICFEPEIKVLTTEIDVK